MTLGISRVLVTGGAGFIGSHIADKLLESGYEVTVLDNFSAGKLENIADHQSRKDFHFIKGDIRDFDLVKNVLKDIDGVFHEAALVSVAGSVENPALTNEVNVTGTSAVLKACVNSDVRRFIYASSSAVYGDTETLPKHEKLTTQPISPYAVSKLSAESYVKYFNKLYGLETVSLRYFNVYGPRQTYGPYSGVIPIFVNELWNNQPPMIYGDGEQTRDFINVRDVANVNLLALEKKSAVGEVFNVATGTAITINQLAKTLQEIMEKNELVPIHINPRVGDIRHSYADVTKAKRVLGYRPEVSLKIGLTELIKWYHADFLTLQ